MKSPSGEWVEHSLQFGFKATNNEAKYENLITYLRLAIKFGTETLLVYSDLALVVNQVNGSFTTASPVIATYLEKSKTIYGKSLKRSN